MKREINYIKKRIEWLSWAIADIKSHNKKVYDPFIEEMYFELDSITEELKRKIIEMEVLYDRD